MLLKRVEMRLAHCACDTNAYNHKNPLRIICKRCIRRAISNEYICDMCTIIFNTVETHLVSHRMHFGKLPFNLIYFTIKCHKFRNSLEKHTTWPFCCKTMMLTTKHVVHAFSNNQTTAAIRWVHCCCCCCQCIDRCECLVFVLAE